MADRGIAASRGVALKVRYRLTPWWLKVIVVFIASRIVSTSILLGFADRQAVNPWTGASPNYFDFAAIWDAHWYRIIALVGYPTELPLTVEGRVDESAWAFMPGYPALVRLFMLVTTLDFPVVAVLVSVGFALGAALMFYRLIHLVLPGSTALFAVVLFCFAPLSPVMQVGYAESMYLFLLTIALYLLVQRRYWLLLPVIAVMSLTRPSGLAFALALLMHVIHRWVVRRREPFPMGERVASVVAGLFSAFMGVAWILVAWAFTGSFTAYTDTELAWRAPYVGYGELIPFVSWVQGALFWAPWFGMSRPLLLVLLGLGTLGFFAILFTPWAKRLGVDLRFWIASYALYLLAVFFPQSSIFRLLVPLFPALGIVAQPRSPVYRIAIVLLFVVGQVAWVSFNWRVDGADWSPP